MRRWTMIFLVMMAAGTLPATSEVAEQAEIAPVEAGTEAGETPVVLGYVDADRDGANDRFQDVDGNGVNDVTRKAYAHRFLFTDENEDGVNDRFADQDGDGVNDLDAGFVDVDRDGVCDNVIDYDGDGINDITGLTYGASSLNGARYGRVDEEQKLVHRQFVDADGDGMHDAPPDRRADGRGGMDHFVDEDGDGICDGRTVRGRGMGRPVWRGQGREGSGNTEDSRQRRGRSDSGGRGAGGEK